MEALQIYLEQLRHILFTISFHSFAAYGYGVIRTQLPHLLN